MSQSHSTVINVVVKVVVNTCFLCAEGLQEPVVQLGCGHFFHEKCMTESHDICQHNQCPTSCPKCGEIVRGATGETLEASEAAPINIESFKFHKGSRTAPIEID